MQRVPGWLEHRDEDVPETMEQAMLTARSGEPAVTLDRLCRVPNTLDDILRALLAVGQVTVFKVSGEIVYRVTVRQGNFR